jgi:hypothetical protein
MTVSPMTLDDKITRLIAHCSAAPVTLQAVFVPAPGPRRRRHRSPESPTCAQQRGRPRSTGTAGSRQVPRRGPPPDDRAFKPASSMHRETSRQGTGTLPRGRQVLLCSTRRLVIQNTRIHLDATCIKAIRPMAAEPITAGPPGH